MWRAESLSNFRTKYLQNKSGNHLGNEIMLLVRCGALWVVTRTTSFLGSLSLFCFGCHPFRRATGEWAWEGGGCSINSHFLWRWLLAGNSVHNMSSRNSRKKLHVKMFHIWQMLLRYRSVRGKVAPVVMWMKYNVKTEGHAVVFKVRQRPRKRWKILSQPAVVSETRHN